MISKSMIAFAGLAATVVVAAPAPMRRTTPAGFTGRRPFSTHVSRWFEADKRGLDHYEQLVADIPNYSHSRRYAALGSLSARDGHHDDENEECDDTPEPPSNPPEDDDCDAPEPPSNPPEDDDCDAPEPPSNPPKDDDCDAPEPGTPEDDCDDEPGKPEDPEDGDCSDAGGDGGDDDDDNGNDDDCVEPDPGSDDGGNNDGGNDDGDCDDENGGDNDGTNTPVSGGGGGSGECKAKYTVVSGDNCSKVAANNNISLADFYMWNPDIDEQCFNLHIGQEYCIKK